MELGVEVSVTLFDIKREFKIDPEPYLKSGCTILPP